MKYIIRLTLYFTGLFTLALGINLAIASNLGVSPVSALPLSISDITGASLGTVTIGVYVIFVLAQILILRRKFKLKSLLQISFGFIFGYFVDFAGVLTRGMRFNSYFMQVLFMVISIFVVSVGVMLIIAMDIVPNAPDGLVLAIGERINFDYGKVKIIFDCTSVILAVVLALLFLGNFSSVREGTIISAILTGKVIAIISKPCVPLLKKAAFYEKGKLSEEDLLEDIPA